MSDHRHPTNFLFYSSARPKDSTGFILNGWWGFVETWRAYAFHRAVARKCRHLQRVPVFTICWKLLKAYAHNIIQDSSSYGENHWYSAQIEVLHFMEILSFCATEDLRKYQKLINCPHIVFSHTWLANIITFRMWVVRSPSNTLNFRESLGLLTCQLFLKLTGLQ